MDVALQGSLFDTTAAEVGVRPLDAVTRTSLAHGAWVDGLPGWLAGPDAPYAHLANEGPWYAERGQMYDRVVAVPRLLCFYDENHDLPHPVLDQARTMLSEHYLPEWGEPFRTAGLCYYRDGRDSVAWHGDRI